MKHKMLWLTRERERERENRGKWGVKQKNQREFHRYSEDLEKSQMEKNIFKLFIT